MKRSHRKTPSTKDAQARTNALGKRQWQQISEDLGLFREEIMHRDMTNLTPEERIAWEVELKSRPGNRERWQAIVGEMRADALSIFRRTYKDDDARAKRQQNLAAKVIGSADVLVEFRKEDAFDTRDVLILNAMELMRRWMQLKVNEIYENLVKSRTKSSTALRNNRYRAKSKFTDREKARYLSLLKSSTSKQVAANAGVSERTLRNWKKKRKL
jgi:DNA-binding CsgD family transcriptional regulator